MKGVSPRALLYVTSVLHGGLFCSYMHITFCSFVVKHATLQFALRRLIQFLLSRYIFTKHHFVRVVFSNTW